MDCQPTIIALHSGPTRTLPLDISREIKRNGGDGNYRAAPADQAAFDRGCRPKLCKLACNRPLNRSVAAKLQLNWSPEQIAGWLKREHPGEESNQVSHETIYRSLFVQARGVLKKELQQHLRSERAIRRSIHSGQHEDGRGQISFHAHSLLDVCLCNFWIDCAGGEHWIRYI